MTDAIIHPDDGAMYFTIGGRRVQSGLYRVTYVGKESTAVVKHKPMSMNPPDYGIGWSNSMAHNIRTH